MKSGKIYDQYYHQVRKFILTYVRDEWAADDLIQETFIRAQKNLDSLKDFSKISSWIFRIAYNLCQDHFRDLKKTSVNEKRPIDATEAFEAACVQKELERNQMGECVQRQVDLLPESLRTVLILFDTMEFSHQEIADILGITVENVKVRLHRARKKLKSLLEKACTFEKDERNVLMCEPVKKDTP
jgi:RNA polymerase sigma-70 factor (ECF subfamily)